MLEHRQTASWQSTSGIQFASSAAQGADYDIHDIVPEHYDTIRIVHAGLMSAVWLIIFPVGAVIVRAMKDPWLVWMHAIIQMLAFWILVVAAGMGIWMAKEIESLHKYHPLMGMILLGLLAIQPATEILNHRLYHRHPKVIITAHIHLWLGRFLLAAGVIQGGLGFMFSASFPHAVVEMWPRAAYGVTAVTMYLLYLGVGIIWPEVRGLKKGRSGGWQMRTQKVRTEAVEAGRMEDLRVGERVMAGAVFTDGRGVNGLGEVWNRNGIGNFSDHVKYASAENFARL